MNEINLKGRTAIVTGAAQGFGLAITKRYLKSGAKVIMWDIDEEYLRKSYKEINNSKNCFINIVDVTDSNQVKNATQESIEDFKNIDIQQKHIFSYYRLRPSIFWPLKPEVNLPELESLLYR